LPATEPSTWARLAVGRARIPMTSSKARARCRIALLPGTPRRSHTEIFATRIYFLLADEDIRFAPQSVKASSGQGPRRSVRVPRRSKVKGQTGKVRALTFDLCPLTLDLEIPARRELHEARLDERRGVPPGHSVILNFLQNCVRVERVVDI